MSIKSLGVAVLTTALGVWIYTKYLSKVLP